MNQFVVPQFIDVEDKIFGPVTTRQFIILLIAGLILFICYKLADLTLFIFLLAIIGGFAIITAFVKINGQPFHYFILNIIQAVHHPSLRIWNKNLTKKELMETRESSMFHVVEHEAIVPRLSYSRIRDLSLIVNTGGYYKS